MQIKESGEKPGPQGPDKLDSSDFFTQILDYTFSEPSVLSVARNTLGQKREKHICHKGHEETQR